MNRSTWWTRRVVWTLDSRIVFSRFVLDPERGATLATGVHHFLFCVIVKSEE